MIPGMDERPELQYNAHWAMAVRALRVGYAGLAAAAITLVLANTRTQVWNR
jgi:hypothetical protein